MNEHGVIIDDGGDKKVPECLVFDYTGDFGGSGMYTRLIDGIGEEDGKRFVFDFYFDGATAKEPQLEAWDDDTHTTITKRVLGGDGIGGESAEDSMVYGFATTFTTPSKDWEGQAIAGGESNRVLLLNDGEGAVDPESAEEGHLYCNLKIVIPEAYDTPAIESFILTVRYTWIS